MLVSLKACAIFFAIFSVHANLVDSESKSHTSRNIIRLLSTYFKPESYDVRLWPILENDVSSFFRGNVKIQVLCLKSFDHIRLNAYDIDINIESVKIIDQVSLVTLPSNPNTGNIPSNEIFTIGANFVGGRRYTISLDFQTQINDNLRGLHGIPYKQNGATRFVYTAQTKPIEARRIFPCFDEPGYLIALNLTVARPLNWTSQSNNILALSTVASELPGYVWDHYFPFKTPMTLNGFGLVISDFIAIPIDWRNEKMVTIRVPNNSVDYVGLAKQKAEMIFIFFEEYFDVPFPFPKLDIVAVPEMAFGTFNTGSYGLSITSESNLLFDVQRGAVADKLQVSNAIAHSLANQWIGTNMKWWNITWETETLSSYLQHVAMDETFPGYWNRFTTTAMREAMVLDALKSIEPLAKNPVVIQDIYAQFNGLIANKGVSLMRMCESLLGKKTLARSIARYLNYKNVQPISLWKALQQQAVQELIQLPFDLEIEMGDWINRPGYPIVYVSKNNYTNTTLIEQVIDSSMDRPWTIPLSYTYDFVKTYNLTINNYFQHFSLHENQTLPIFFNAYSTGFYRVMYERDNYDMITSQLLNNHKSIPAVHRALLLDDALNLARAGFLSYNIALNLTQYLRLERDLITWLVADKALGYIDNMLQGRPNIEQWRECVNATLWSLYQELFERENSISNTSEDDTKQLRALVYHWMCVRLEDSHCVNHAWSLYFSNSLPPDQRFLVICTVIAEGGKDEWEFALTSYRNQSLLARERLEYLRALGCTKNGSHLIRALEMVLNSNELPSKHDALLLFEAIATSPKGNEVAIDFFIQHWEKLSDRFGNTLTVGAEPLPLLFRFLCDQINKPGQLDKIKKFYDGSNNAWTVIHQSQMVSQGMEIATNNVLWFDYFEKPEVPNSAPELCVKTILVIAAVGFTHIL